MLDVLLFLWSVDSVSLPFIRKKCQRSDLKTYKDQETILLIVL